jgi:hypothetical protein
MSVHTRRPCVCVYFGDERVQPPQAAKDETARGRRVCELTHTANTLICVLMLFCLQHKLHTHTTGDCHLCVQSVGTGPGVDYVPS